MSTDLPSQIHTELGSLSFDAQQSVLEYVLALKRTSKGMPASRLKQHVGSLPANDAKQMMDTIDEGCEQVDSDGW